tara:strand:- start:1370 stop:1558 length:189 start_codon:yes stop_codon:yes gene_type:complete
MENDLFSDKIKELGADLQKVESELSRLNQLRSRLLGAIEVVSQLEEECKGKCSSKKKDKKEK